MKFNYRIIIFAISIIFAIVYSVPSIFQTKEGAKITLGLDLQGGLHLLLGVKTDEAVVSRIKSIASSVKHYTEHNEILVDSLGVTASTVEFTLLDHDDAKNISKLFADMKGVKVDIKGDSYTVSLTPEEIAKTKQQAVTQAIETIRNRLDQFGLSEPVVARQGEDKILVELPGIKTQVEEQRARELISRSAKLELMAVDEGRGARVSTLTPLDASNMGDEILPDAQMEGVKHLVHEIPILDGGMLTDARVEFDKNNRPVISFTLNSEGAQIFGDFTAKNVGNHLAIVLDGKVYSAPVINERIGGGSGQISGNYTMEGAQDLAIALRSGALLAPIYVMEKRSIGPSLGADSIHSSMMALYTGLFLVFAFMMFYYRLAGVIANVALVVNLLLIIAIMALFGATLTLPGMAGIVLTVGMAVDSNVIISERIRELLYQGVSLKKAIQGGYANAMRAIVDSNITTLIASIVLYVYGTGTIKGFAITITIGITVSMLTAILGTHGIYDLLDKKAEKSKNHRLWFGIKD